MSIFHPTFELFHQCIFGLIPTTSNFSQELSAEHNLLLTKISEPKLFKAS